MRGASVIRVGVVLVPLIALAAYAWAQPPAGQKPPPGAAGDADAGAIRKSALAFAEAFNKGDAKAVAAMWTENGECCEATGLTFVGREEIEKAYAAFFKANAGAKIEVLVQSVRFPAKDMAVEEGLVRQSGGPKDLPQSANYVAVHVRDGGQWKMAMSSESDNAQDRLEDLDWLLGEWTAAVKKDAVKFSFARDPKKAVVTATVTRTPAGKDPVSGSIRMALDPETAPIRAW